MKGLNDADEEAAAEQQRQGAASLRNLHYPEIIIKEESEPYRSLDVRGDSSKLKEESVAKDNKPLLKQGPRRKIYHHWLSHL